MFVSDLIVPYPPLLYKSARGANFLLHFSEFVLYYYSNRSQGRSTG